MIPDGYKVLETNERVDLGIAERVEIYPLRSLAKARARELNGNRSVPSYRYVPERVPWARGRRPFYRLWPFTLWSVVPYQNMLVEIS